MTRSSVSRTEALVLLLLTLSVSPLSATWYSSNPLGQKLGEVDNLSSSGWYLEEKGNISSLYGDGALYSVTEYGDDTITTKTGNSKKIVHLDPDGRPVIIEEGSIMTQNSWSDDGRLLSTVVTRDDEIMSITEYFDAFDGTLSRSDSEGLVYIFASDDFYRSEGGEVSAVRRIADGLYIREGKDGVEVSEENSEITITDKAGNGKVVYLPNGLLKERTDRNGTTLYSYSDDGLLEKEERITGIKRTVVRYEDGKESSRENWENDILSSVIRKNGDGTFTKDMYRKGKLYAVVRYDRDGVTVLSVEVKR